MHWSCPQSGPANVCLYNREGNFHKEQAVAECEILASLIKSTLPEKY